MLHSDAGSQSAEEINCKGSQSDERAAKPSPDETGCDVEV
jgi:hypothetical protein